MVRQIVVPDTTRLQIDLPEDFVGKRVEVIAFELEEERPESQTASEKKASIRTIFEGVRVDLSGYKFDRDEANNYDE